MSSVHTARANLFGFFHHPRTYDRHISRFFGGVHARIVADVAAAGLDPADRVLDVGTGPGGVPLALANAVPHVRVDGLDLSAGMIEFASAAVPADLRDRVSFVVGDVAALPYPDESFDLVVSSMSQHHWPDAYAGLRELRRVLRPGGRIWIYDARIALRRAAAAARAVFPANAVRRETVRTGRLPVSLVGRLVAEGPE